MPLKNGDSGRLPEDDQIRRNERRYAALIERLTPDQALACVDLMLDLRSPWIRRVILELPLAEGDEIERQTLLYELDAMVAPSAARAV